MSGVVGFLLLLLAVLLVIIMVSAAIPLAVWVFTATCKALGLEPDKWE